MLAKQLAAGATVVAANNDVELKPARAAVLCLLVGYPLRPQLRDLLLDVQRRGPTSVRDGVPHLRKQLARRYPAAIHHAVTPLFALMKIEGEMAGHAGGSPGDHFRRRGREEEAERRGGARIAALGSGRRRSDTALASSPSLQSLPRRRLPAPDNWLLSTTSHTMKTNRSLGEVADDGAVQVAGL